MAERIALVRTSRMLFPASKARFVVALALAIIGPVVSIALGVSDLFDTFSSLPFVVTIVVVTGIGRLGAGLVAIVVSILLLDYYVVPPLRSFNPAEVEGVVDLAFFLMIGFVVARLTARQEQAIGQARIDRNTAAQAEQRAIALASIGRALAEPLDSTTSLHKATEIAAKQLCDHVMVFLSNEAGTLDEIAAAHANPSGEGLVPDLNGDLRHLARALSTGETQAITEMAVGLRSRSDVVVPMRILGRTTGVVSFTRTTNSTPFSDADTVLAEQIADRMSHALENRRLYDDQVFLATTLQRSFLPRTLPEIPGFRLAARYVSGSAGLEIGGDFYDVFEIGRDRWIAFVGDVCGKGPEAAAVMAIARTAIRTLALHESSPARLLAGLNDVLLDQVPDHRFCTVCCALVKGRDGVTIALGGHPRGCILRRDGTVEWAGSYGSVIGAFADITVTETHFELSSGDALVMFTDGLDSRGKEAEDVAGEILSGKSNQDPEAIVEALVSNAKRDTTRRLDDLAVLVFQATHP